MAHSGAEILFFLSFESSHIFAECSISSIFISVGRLVSFSLNIFPLSQGGSLSVEEKVGLWSIQRQVAEAHSITYWDPKIPSLHICHGVFALFDCWGQFTLNPVCTKCKQKPFFMFLRCFHFNLKFPNIIIFL